jgi:hypothetical protein
MVSFHIFAPFFAGAELQVVEVEWGETAVADSNPDAAENTNV